MGRHSRWRTVRIKGPHYELSGARPIPSNEANGPWPVHQGRALGPFKPARKDALGKHKRPGLMLIEEVDGLDGYHLLHAARADLLCGLSRSDDAASACRRAYESAMNYAACSRSGWVRTSSGSEEPTQRGCRAASSPPPSQRLPPRVANVVWLATPHQSRDIPPRVVVAWFVGWAAGDDLFVGVPAVRSNLSACDASTTKTSPTRSSASAT
jgi:hypothetical protein